MVSVGFAVLLFFLFGKPYKRGFFCNDESLYHPFHSSTVTSAMLYVVGLFLPICAVSHLLRSMIFLYLKKPRGEKQYWPGDVWSVLHFVYSFLRSPVLLKAGMIERVRCNFKRVFIVFKLCIYTYYIANFIFDLDRIMLQDLFVTPI